jgi:16S rRNA (guanine527-N7)-methyltransferase
MTEGEKQRFRDLLQEAAESVGVPLSDAQLHLCAEYTQRLLVVNEQMNLTRITALDAIAIKHFADSLAVLRAVPTLSEIAQVMDVGTGAGFPGMVLKIARPSLQVTLLDSLAKRLTFLSDTIAAIGLEDVKTFHARAEDAGRSLSHRESYDLVTARAVASLPTLLEWCGPLVKVGGTFAAMKGASISEELAISQQAAVKMGLRLVEIYPCMLPMVEGDTDPPQRHLLIFEKVGQTPARFPRKPAEIKAHPL